MSPEDDPREHPFSSCPICRCPMSEMRGCTVDGKLVPDAFVCFVCGYKVPMIGLLSKGQQGPPS